MPRSSVIAAIADKGFSPANVAGLQLWLDASDTATITESSGSVSQWDDKSGNGNHVSQGTAANQPTTGTDTVNGKNVLTFSQTAAQHLRTATGVTVAEPYTVLLVAVDDDGGSQNKFAFSTRDSFRHTIRVSDNDVTFRVDNTVTKTGVLTVSEAFLASMVANGASSVTSFNGSATNEDLGTFSGIELITVGVPGSQLDSTDTDFEGKIAEILIYDSALSTADREAVEQYLADRWDITLAKQPDEVAGLQLWLDASDTSTITESGGAVSQWDDKSGNANHATQGTAASQPTTGTRTINGLNVLDFDGSDDFLRASFGATSSQPTTTFVVAAQDATSPNQHIIDGVDAGERAILLLARNDYVMFAGATLSGGSTNTNVNVYRIVYDGASSSLHSNGALIMSGDPGTAHGVSGATIGARFDDTSPINGRVAEVVHYQSALSTADREAIEVGLAQKWGITFS